jgi:myo-inositol 2-dehydrogenase/D-chiro-inositol 1-dehydrogenase
MRVGVIGVGRMGQTHAATLGTLEDVDGVLVTDVDMDRAEKVAADAGARTAQTVEELLASVDAVVIAAASSAHADLIHASADAGLPTFCEKPITLDLGTTAEVVEHVRRSGIRLQMGFQRRFDAGFRAARDLIVDGSLGVLYVVRMAGHDPAPPHEEYIPASGGIFRDFSVHDFDALRFVTGQETVEVFADGAVLNFPQFDTYGDVDTAVATLRMSEGTRAILSCTRHDPLGYDIRTELFGSYDSVSVGLGPRTPLRSVEPGVPPPAGPAWSAFPDRFADAYREELRAFLRVARGEEESACTARDGLEAVRVAVAATRSMREHRPVKVAEVE